MKAELVKYSTNGTNTICSFILEYPRYTHAQMLTHRVFSKNSSSSRAIPTQDMIANIYAEPVRQMWTHNQKGMQGPLVEDQKIIDGANKVHDLLFGVTLNTLRPLLRDGWNLHKQNVNRYLEAFQNIRVLYTTTELDNFFHLRIDSEAQPEIAAIAKMMEELLNNAEPQLLFEGEYHLPFVDSVRDAEGKLQYFELNTNQTKELTLEEAILISVSASAQTSYRALDTTIEKARDMQSKLKTNKFHASPFEHQATPIPSFTECEGVTQNWPEGITHMDRNYNYWSGNFRNWIQHRQLLSGHDAAKF